MELYSMLKRVTSEGIPLYLEGELASPEEIADQYCLNENSIYMPDYVLDESGKLAELRYDKINNR